MSPILTRGALLLAMSGLACGNRDDELRPPGRAVVADAIVIDGEFDEWTEIPTTLADPADTPEGAAVDLGEIRVHSDGRFLYFTVETGRMVNAQAMLGSVSILMDSDDESTTGASVGDLAGVDLVLELSRTDQLRESGFGSGIGIRTATEQGSLGPQANAGQLDVIVAPTSAASRFEIRVRRGVRRGVEAGDRNRGLLVGESARIQVIYEADRETVDRTDIAVVELAPFSDTSPQRWSDPVSPAAGDLRAVVWNVASEGFRDRPERFARVLGGLEPHVVLLDEVFGDVTTDVLDAFFASGPLSSLGHWDYVLGRSGGRQKTVVASRVGVRPEPALQDLPYPEGSLEALAAAFPEPQARRLFGLERDRGLASTGAWVAVGGLPVLFVPIDLQSAGYAGSFEDQLRKLQAATLRERVAEVLTAAGDPVATVIGGDLNLVGSRDPLDILVRGLDRDGADLVPADARRLTDRSYATWRSDNVPFTPGRLDFVLVPERALDVTRAFAFDATELSDALRNDLGIAADDPTMTSDHLPLVVDLRRRIQSR